VATSAQLKTYGADRRIVTVPIVNTSRKVVDFACMLMLEPMAIPVNDVSSSTWAMPAPLAAPAPPADSRAARPARWFPSS
jgi:hypothetical protein